MIWPIKSATISNPALPASFSISDSNSDDHAASPFFMLLIYSLTMTLFIKSCGPLTVSASEKLFLSLTTSVKKSK